MLASWVQQCSFHPPLFTAAIKRGREIGDLLMPGVHITLNILEEGQSDMIAHFGKGFSLKDGAFSLLDVTRRPDAGPILNESLAYLDAEIIDRVGAGDHDLIVANITSGRVLDDGQPMIHVRKNGFHY
jgi:flavin reductase (DIM6/NTAB) family NADH-FMN oxidoreductase RutF